MTNLSYYSICEKALRQMAWGFVLLIIDINFMNFDILNDLLGYILILYSLSSLERESKLFQKVKWITFILFIVSFITDWIPAMSLSIGQWSSDISLFSIVYGQVYSLIDLLMMVLLFISLGQLSIWHQMSDPSLEEAFITRRKALIGLLVLQQFVYPFIINLEQDWPIVMVIYAVLYVFFMFLLIRLLFRLANAYGELHQGEEQDKDMSNIHSGDPYL